MFAATEEKKRKTTVRKRVKPYEMRISDVSGFLEKIRKDGRSGGTLLKYQCDLNRFYDYLDKDKLIQADTLQNWKQGMVEAGYAPRTINSSIVAINRFYEYVGCRDWKLFEWMELDDPDDEELTREEYQLLLREAKVQEKVQLYLIIKTLASTDLTPSDLVLLTREAVDQGVVCGKSRGTQGDIVLPQQLREDLLHHAIEHKIKKGPIFLGNSNKPLGRSVITKYISILGEDAGLEPGKANPRNLRRLHLSTLAEFQRQADAWVNNSYRQLLSEEESFIGWRVR